MAIGLLFANNRDSIYLYGLNSGVTYLIFHGSSYRSSYVSEVAVAPQEARIPRTSDEEIRGLLLTGGSVRH